jgi:regulator of cell morphogenesis and NO signaling
MMTACDITLAQLVAERPGRARILEDFGLDYCCGGVRTLAEACAEQHIDADELCQRLQSEEGAGPDADDIDLRFVPLSELIEHIVDVHHSYLRRELPRLDKLLDRVVGAHGAEHPELLEATVVFQSLAQELTAHMWKEEHVLFPWIGLLEDPADSPAGVSVAHPIEVMEHEHRDAADALARLRRLTGNYQPPADACDSYRLLLAGLRDLERDLHRHVHEENNILFPRAAALENRL